MSKARVFSTRMNIWSNEKPSKPGYYWFRDKQIKKPGIIFINEVEIIMDGYQWAKIEEPKEGEE